MLIVFLSCRCHEDGVDVVGVGVLKDLFTFTLYVRGLILVTWYLVHGIWYMVLGTWYLVHGTWYLVLGTWSSCTFREEFVKVVFPPKEAVDGAHCCDGRCPACVV